MGTKEFAEKMRMLIWRGMPGLTSQIHRPPDVDAEDSVVPHSLEPDPTWKWEEAEKRLRVAYDDGGFPAWIQLAVKEMEDELKVERARRQRQFDHSQTKSLS
ncbi:hypothetical protein H0H81_000237 [Sphagnurus paluster]|uniref:Uncharacterized protein n=1 Tax=Sphagnurus paluster TaxID=117069 RepID=A0A9P7GNQ9_9AGAR|nr:hypothetical protein H0H81_000237 [Sphagnurus paluster]